MRKRLLLLFTILSFLSLSSFGIAENNNYTRSKAHQIQVVEKQASNTWVKDLKTPVVVTEKVETDEPVESFATALGGIVITAVKAVFTAFFNFIAALF